MAGELAGISTSIQVGDGGTTEVFTTIAGVQGIPRFPAVILPTTAVTALDSIAEEFITGLGDPGAVDFTVYLRPAAGGAGWVASQAQLEGYSGDGLLHNFKIFVKKGATTVRTYKFTALVIGFEPAAGGANTPVTAAVKLKASGGVTLS